MADTLLDYNKQNKYLPESLRMFIGATDRMSKQDYNQFFTMFSGVEQLAVFNNRVAAEFASGFTNLNYKYLRSGAAPKLKKILVDKTVGRVYYQTGVDEAELQSLFDKDYFSDVLYRAFDMSASTGRALCVVYGTKEDKDVNIMSYNLFRHRCIYDSKHNVKEAWMFIVKLESAAVGYEYVICEHRFYNTKGEPMQEFEVWGISYTDQSKKNSNKRRLQDTEITDSLKGMYPDIKFNVPIKLDMSNIGVFDITFTKINSKFIDSDIPEAMFVDASDNALVLDTSITDKEVEKEIGRAQLLIPEFGRDSDVSTYQTQAAVGSRVLRTTTRSYRSPIVMPYPTRSVEDSKPTSVQFDIRSEQWNSQIDNDTARLCASVGISVLDYDPRLLQTGQRTDDEINAMTDITIQTVKTFRDINTRKVNDMLACVCEILGIPQPVAIRWSMAAIMNPTKNNALVTSQLQAGLISRKEALRRLNPDYTENEIQQLLDEINAEMENASVVNAFNNF